MSNPQLTVGGQLTNPWIKGLSTNTTASAFTVRGSLAAEPTAVTGGIIIPRTSLTRLALMAFGTNTTNQTAHIGVIGWNPATDIDGTPEAAWIAMTLGVLTFTLSTGAPPEDGTIIASTDFMADTVAAHAEDVGNSTLLSPTANSGPAVSITPVEGCQLTEVQAIVGSVTNINFLWRMF